ncbi:cupin domain-containing protein [Acuticoccus sediminis]|uniref:Cupin domain-containing protein n=1 Tax=Acuticoccus sediminis TaxID=2184697 RepID=A0A8B2NQC4_9HYPH|nr:cupin domain-containing protein [Acuticoccus sediminis]RAH99392.1 cupin domain-containing protein [Acuticoccus sediminis]
MKIVRCGELDTVVAPASYFTGTVFQQPIVTAPEPARVNAAAVTFTPGARTNWHTHPLGQTLHVVSGSGWFQTEGEARIDIHAGDSIWIPPGEKHWHGATDTKMMTHIAIHERDGDAGHITWLEPVEDADYLAGR